jgi:hypothetical protein
LAILIPLIFKFGHFWVFKLNDGVQRWDQIFTLKDIPWPLRVDYIDYINISGLIILCDF